MTPAPIVAEPMNPTILLIANANADLLLAEFTRYQRDYNIQLVRSTDEGFGVACDAAAEGGHLALMVTDTSLWMTTDPSDSSTTISFHSPQPAHWKPAGNGIVLSR